MNRITVRKMALWVYTALTIVIPALEWGTDILEKARLFLRDNVLKLSSPKPPL